ncbi:MAG: peptide deformylase [Candidatus Falkowbacteria bacterium]|nr:peptide deformylase [Candidatus Falkowbacteria bacterium]
MKKKLKKLDLVINPNPILRNISVNVNMENLDKAFAKLIESMIFTMIEDNGIGLAAPQIGKNIRLIVINHKSNPFALINPVITKKSKRLEIGEEGCLSVPNIYGNVQRYYSIECEYCDLSKNKQIMKANGLLARVIQHEIDHLDGILFIDKAVNIIKKNESN